MSWRQFILALGLYTAEEIDTVRFRAYLDRSSRIRDLLRRHAKGRKRGAQMSGGHFIGRLADHFGLLTEERLQGTTMVVRELTEIDMDELVAVVRAREDVEGAHAKVEGDQAVLSPVQAPQPPPAAAQTRTMPQRVTRLGEEVHELRQSIVGLHRVVDRSITDQSRFATWMISCMTQLMDARGRTYQAFDTTFVGTDIAKIIRKRSKPDKHEHENGKSAKEPEVSSKRSTKSSLGQEWSTHKK
ncbi:hypothetical protein Tco_1258066 [Tanacetum coccineum]